MGQDFCDKFCITMAGNIKPRFRPVNFLNGCCICVIELLYCMSGKYCPSLYILTHYIKITFITYTQLYFCVQTYMIDGNLGHIIMDTHTFVYDAWFVILLLT